METWILILILILVNLLLNKYLLIIMGEPRGIGEYSDLPEFDEYVKVTFFVAYGFVFVVAIIFYISY